MDQKRWKEFIARNGEYFWWVPEEAKQNLSEESVVEAILNYGNMENLRELFELLGTERVAEIFSKQIKQKRCNYLDLPKNYFTLYFKEHAPKYFN